MRSKAICSSAALQKQMVPMSFKVKDKGTEIRLAPLVYVSDIWNLLTDHLDCHARWHNMLYNNSKFNHSASACCKITRLMQFSNYLTLCNFPQLYRNEDSIFLAITLFTVNIHTCWAITINNWIIIILNFTGQLKILPSGNKGRFWEMILFILTP